MYDFVILYRTKSILIERFCIVDIFPQASLGGRYQNLGRGKVEEICTFLPLWLPFFALAVHAMPNPTTWMQILVVAQSHAGGNFVF